MKKIVVFASGDGTNAQRLIDHFKNSSLACITLIVTNNPKAKIIERARLEEVPCLLIDKKSFNETTHLLGELQYYKIDFIVLAGFLWLIPHYLIKAYPDKIINIHPALLPKYGGKGMYGMNIHKEVIENKEKKSGITIHYVNEQYDTGKIILKAECEVEDADTAETLATKIRELEHTYYPEVIERLIELS